tara:strand:- start:172 stop:486 length:315 start_codon:yes stop_codon:yes gene_type:complete
VIKVSVLYPHEEDELFDYKYWNTTHLSLVQELLGPMGLVKGEMEEGVSGTDPNSPPPFVAVAHLFFNSTEEVHEAFAIHARTIIADIPNYTNIKPIFQISKILD